VSLCFSGKYLFVQQYYFVLTALGIEAESPERSGVKRSAVRTWNGKPGPQGTPKPSSSFYNL